MKRNRTRSEEEIKQKLIIKKRITQTTSNKTLTECDSTRQSSYSGTIRLFSSGMGGSEHHLLVGLLTTLNSEPDTMGASGSSAASASLLSSFCFVLLAGGLIEMDVASSDFCEKNNTTDVFHAQF